MPLIVIGEIIVITVIGVGLSFISIRELYEDISILMRGGNKSVLLTNIFFACIGIGLSFIVFGADYMLISYALWQHAKGIL